jgi:2-methylisocitrate lyase-like PEP mutase family enzyme
VLAPAALGAERHDLTLAATIPVPVNTLVVPDLTLKELAALGVRRVSTGSRPYRAALDAAVGVATAVRDGDPPVVATPYPQAQQSLIRFAGRTVADHPGLKQA